MKDKKARNVIGEVATGFDNLRLFKLSTSSEICSIVGLRPYAVQRFLEEA